MVINREKNRFDENMKKEEKKRKAEEVDDVNRKSWKMEYIGWAKNAHDFTL